MTGAAPITILGGGPAGLAAGYYANAASIDFELYEASGDIGGNCRTIRFGDFLVDTGAHRLHDRDPDMIAIARRLLGDDLLGVHAPSQLLHDRRLIDFPLRPLNLARRLPVATTASIVWENIRNRTRRASTSCSFGSNARATYGDTLASLALLNYSQKLWGRDPNTLVAEIAGTRLAPLDLRTFIVESIRGSNAASRHLDGAFYYPRLGIGQFFERIGDVIGEHVHVRSPITRIEHHDGLVTAIEINGEERRDISQLVNTLPLGVTARLMDPLPPCQILDAANAIRFRHVRLCILIVNLDRFTANASIYFPDARLPFTRLYESKSRSAAMGRDGATALVLEVPFEAGDRIAALDADAFADEVQDALVSSMGLHPDHIIARHELVIPNAYPVLELAARPHVASLRRYMDSFDNMTLVGRNATFQYSSIHDQFVSARSAITRFASTRSLAVQEL